MKRNEKTKKKQEQPNRKKTTGVVFGIIFVLIFLAVIMGIYMPVWKSSAQIEGFEKYAKSIENVGAVDAEIIALGEGTHGTKEFHELKLEVFKELVDNGCRAFVIEGTFGDGEVINDYIQGGITTLDEAYAQTSYRCYKTDETKALLKWMREYNDSVNNDSEKVRFYGCDIQYFDNSSKLILNYLRNAKCEEVEQYASWLEEFQSTGSFYSEEEKNQLIAKLDELEKMINAGQDETSVEYRHAIEDCEVLKMGVELNTSALAYQRDRDLYMFETLKWIINEEKEYFGNSKIMLSAHDGHIAKGQTANYKTLGMYISEEYGNRYYAIGTDFYKGTVNLPKNGSRTVQSWNTADPLAAQLKNMNMDKAYIDFGSVAEGEKLYKIINEEMYMGSLGESYSAIMHLFSNSYRIKKVPTDFYDAMILVYESTATTIVWDK